MERISVEELRNIVYTNRLRGNEGPALKDVERAAFTISEDAKRIKELEDVLKKASFLLDHVHAYYRCIGHTKMADEIGDVMNRADKLLKIAHPNG